MSAPTFSEWPPIPSRSAPEADFDAMMYALFQHFAVTHRDETLAFIAWLQTNSTIIGGALNDTTMGLTSPAAAKFTDLTVSKPGSPSIVIEDGDETDVRTGIAQVSGTTIITSKDNGVYGQTFLQLNDGVNDKSAQRWSADGAITLYNLGTAALVVESGGDVRPGSDNLKSCGTAASRWSVVYAGTGAINTSDAREKTEILDIDAAETRVAQAVKGLIKKFKFNDAVAAKGSTGARWHFGVIAQELQAAFEAEGLDPWAYGVMCRDEWWEADVTVPAAYATRTTAPATFDQDGAILSEAVTEQVLLHEAYTERRAFKTEQEAPEGAQYHERLGVRPDELSMFVLSAI